MARIVVVHGIGKQVSGPEQEVSEWLPALRSGLTLAGGPAIAETDVVCGFYGDLFRRPGTRTGIPNYTAEDVDSEFEHDLLRAWWEAASGYEAQVTGPDAATRGRTPRIAQRALDALSHSRFFAGMAEHALIADLKQVRTYLADRRIRAEARSRVEKCVSDDTKVIVAHSLGSVVAYEALCANPGWPVRTLVTLGSPLGIRNLIFDRLEPTPRDGLGSWPGPVATWVNVADAGDIVALVKKLSSRFGARVEDMMVNNDARAHNVRPYLTAKEVGRAIASGLAG
jgi:hypothetical protein